MGLIYETCKRQSWIKPYADQGLTVRGWSAALLQAGKSEVDVPAADISANEVEALALKLDQMFPDSQNDSIARWVAAEFPSIVLTVRRVAKETGGIFGGILGAGGDLDIKLLRAKDIGNAILSSGGTGGTGAYAGTGAAVYTYLYTFTANVAVDLIPAQKMIQYAGVIHLGWKTSIEIPKISDVVVYLDGNQTGPQSVMIQRRTVDQSPTEGIFKFEKPVIVQPLRQQEVKLNPNITGDDKPELISFLVARISDLITYM